MKYNLFLDDFRSPCNIKHINLPLLEYKIAKNYNEFCEIINKNGIPNFVSYDHDLADEHYQDLARALASNCVLNYSQYKEKTGYDCAQFLIEKCSNLKVKHPNFVVHSMNVIGRQNIMSLIRAFNKNEYQASKLFI